MAWVGVEEDMGPAMRVPTLLGGAAAIPVWWNDGFWMALAAFYGAGIVGMVVRDLWKTWRLPVEARSAAKQVQLWFREQFPNSRIESVAVRAIEPEQFVIAVRYEDPPQKSIPTARRYFAISRANGDAISELPIGEWWPRGLK